MGTQRLVPRLCRRLLERWLPSGLVRDGLIGDLEELYAERARGGVWSADLWYLAESLFAVARYRPVVEAVVAWAQGRPSLGWSREGRRGPMRKLSALGGELRVAGRRLRRSPGFTVAAVVTLAIGFGATALIYGVVYRVVLAPLPYPDADRLVVIEHELPGWTVRGEAGRFGGYQGVIPAYAEGSRLLEAVAGWGTFETALVDGDADPEYVRIGYATPGLMPMLGGRPLVGRGFRSDDRYHMETGRGVFLLSRALWQRRYGGEPGVTGRLVEHDGYEFEIVGVLPALRFPKERAQAWQPRPYSMLDSLPTWAVHGVLARMAPGATVDDVTRELDGLIERLPERYPGGWLEQAVVEGRMTAVVMPFHEWLIGDLARSLWLFLAAAFAIFLIACVNVGNLLLIRADARQREVAVRVALGAGGRDLGRYFVAESVLIVGTAALLSVAVAVVGLELLANPGPIEIPRLDEPASPWRVPAFVAGLAVAAAAVFSLVPWLHTARDAVSALRAGERAGTSGRDRVRLRNALVAAQLALAVVLMVGAGLMLRSFIALHDQDPGFRDEDVLTFRVPFPFREVQDAGAALDRASPFYLELRDRIARLPGVARVGFADCVPLSPACDYFGTPVRPEGWEDRDQDELPVIGMSSVSPGYLPTLGVPVLRGRGLTPADDEGRTAVALVSASLAEGFWPGQDPIGKRIERPIQAGAPWQSLRIVGVVGDVHTESLREAVEPMAYVPVRKPRQQLDLWLATFVVKTSYPPLGLVGPIRDELRALRPDIPLAGVRTMSGMLDDATAPLRFSLWLLALAAGTAMLLSGIGLYGVVAYVVGLRRGELGIRLALGARSDQLRNMVLRHGALVAGLGLAAGVGLALLASPLLRALLFGVQPTDPAAYVGTVLFLALVVLIATWLPARRAAGLDPAEALRR